MDKQLCDQLKDAHMFNMDRWTVAEMVQKPIEFVDSYFDALDASQRRD